MIEKIEIQYFRSIYRASVTKVKDINVFTGKNDVGKSNVLKALNLFFNNCIEQPGDYSFPKNYNLRRLEEVRKDTIKGKQFIRIKVTFNRGKEYEKSLPKRFTVTKKWNRDSVTPIVNDDLEYMLRQEGRELRSTNRTSLTRFMNRIQFVYIPAVKDSVLFDKLLSDLQDTVYSKSLSQNKKLNDSMNELAVQVAGATRDLSNEFEAATGINSEITTPSNVAELYTAIKIITKAHEGAVDLKDRGDGIQARYIPTIIDYIAKQSTKHYVWGFEEPENSLEFNMARQMAEAFYSEYSKRNLIFLTTHSPAFIDVAKREKGSGYRCYSENGETKIASFQNEADIIQLSEELGYAYILQKQYDDYTKSVRENEKLKEAVSGLERVISETAKPVVFTEGKTDAIILKEAWSKLYSEEMPFELKSCSLVKEEKDVSEIAGVEVLGGILRHVRHDQPSISIGLFDNDDAGQKAFELDKNYIISETGKWKRHKNGKGFAVLLPTDEETRVIAEAKKLTIEKMFDYKDVITELDGRGLRLKPAYVEKKIHNTIIGTEEATDDYWYLRDVEKDSKLFFAENVVPSFNKDSFVRFRSLFEIIFEIIKL